MIEELLPLGEFWASNKRTVLEVINKDGVLGSITFGTLEGVIGNKKYDNGNIELMIKNTKGEKK